MLEVGVSDETVERRILVESLRVLPGPESVVEPACVIRRSRSRQRRESLPRRARSRQRRESVTESIADSTGEDSGRSRVPARPSRIVAPVPRRRQRRRLLPMENPAEAAAWKRGCAHDDVSEARHVQRTFLLACCHAGRTGSSVSAAEGARQAQKAMAALRQAVTIKRPAPRGDWCGSGLCPPIRWLRLSRIGFFLEEISAGCAHLGIAGQSRLLQEAGTARRLV